MSLRVMLADVRWVGFAASLCLTGCLTGCLGIDVFASAGEESTTQTDTSESGAQLPDDSDAHTEEGGATLGESGGEEDLPVEPEPPSAQFPHPLTGFSERSLELGIEVFHNSQSNTFSTPGIAWGDFDADGDMDVVLTNQMEANQAYVGSPEGSFSVAPWAGELALSGHVSSGAVAADYDNDGYLDLYLLADGPNTLLRNLGGAGEGPRFEDRSLFAGVADAGMGETASFADYDGDGLLDLYLANNNFSPPDRLYHNRGDGSFEDVSHLLELDARARPAFSSSFFDYDLDGDPDLYVVNDKQAGNVLWRNDGPGCGGWCFSDVSHSSGAGLEMFSMGVAVGDYDNDGDSDIFVSNIGPAVLLENRSAQADPSFVEVAGAAGVLVDDDGWGDLSWGAQFLDFDNDGWLDLYVNIAKMDPGPSQPNCLFHNNGDGTFTKLEDAGGASDPRLSFALAQADFDSDGWIDLLVGNVGDRYTLFHNLGAGHHYLDLLLRSEDPSVNRDGIGSKVIVLDDQGRTQVRELVAGSSLGTGSSLHLHFGLGEALPLAATLVWPNGDVELFHLPPVDTSWAVVKQAP